MPIIPGSSFELYAHGEELECHVVKIYSMTLPSSGAAAGTSELPANTSEVLRPKCVGAGRQAKVKIRTNVPIYVEAFEDCKSLGRVALRTRGVTVAVGVVTRA